MQFLVALMVLAGFVGFLVGVIALIQPTRWVSSRGRAAGLVTAALVVIALAAAAEPPPAAETSHPAAATPPASAAPAVGAQRVASRGPSQAAIDAGFTTTQTALFAAAKPCDAAMAKAAKTHGQYASYNVSVAAEQVCRQAAIDIGNAHFGDPVPATAQDDLNKAVDCFAMAYGLRAGAMEQAAALMDGDQRPSKVAAFRDTLRYAGEQHQACLEQYATAAAAHGFAKQIGWTDKD